MHSTDLQHNTTTACSDLIFSDYILFGMFYILTAKAKQINYSEAGVRNMSV